MKRILTAVMSLAALAVGAPAFAGGEHCTLATQACLDQMAENLQHRGYIGIEMDENETHATVIKKVVEASPAQKAGLAAGDILLTVNGMAPEEGFTSLKDQMTPGVSLVLGIQRDGAEQDVTVVLAKVPEDLMARWIGIHMLQHTTQAQAEAEEE